MMGPQREANICDVHVSHMIDMIEHAKSNEDRGGIG